MHQVAQTANMPATPGTIHSLTFRSRVAAVVTGIGAVLESISGTGSLILTLLIDGSVAAILTLSNSANEVAREFTLTANRTLTSLGQRIQIGTPTHSTGAVTVVYQYRVVPGATFSINAALT
jgi:hypothetical protein